MRHDLLNSSMASEYDQRDTVYNDRDSEFNNSEFNNSEYYYNPTDDMTNDESSHFEDLVQTYMKDVHYTTITQTALNLTYSMINVGIVMLPSCAYEAGIPLFIACVLFFTALSAYISSLLVEMAEDERVRSLEALSERAFGARGYFVTCIIQLIFSFTIICVTLGEWGSVIPTVIKSNFVDDLPKGMLFNVLTDRKFIVIVGSLMALPGCFSRTFSTLSWSSVFTLSTIIVTIAWSLYILYRYLDDPDESNGKNVLKIRSLWWTTEVVICFALSFQQKLFFVFNCLRRRSVKRFAPAVKYSHLFIALLYITFGCVCAVHLTDVTNFKHFNYFKDYKQTNESRVVFDITRTIVSFSLLFTIPVESLVVVTVWRRLWRRYNRYKKAMSYSSAEQQSGVYNRVGPPLQAQSGIPDDEESDDETMLREREREEEAAATKMNNRVCCLEMSSLFSSRDSEKNAPGRYCSNERTDPRKPCPTSASRQTVSTACTTTNNSVERYLQRMNTFDAPLVPPSPSYKSNTTDDNLKTISSGFSETTSNGSSGMSGNSGGMGQSPPRTPSRQRRTVSFQDEAASPRPLSSPLKRNASPRHNHVSNQRKQSSTLHTNRNSNSHSHNLDKTQDMNTSIHLAADSPHLISQSRGKPSHTSIPPPTSSRFSHPPLGSSQSQERTSDGGAYANDSASVVSSFLGSSVFGDVTTLDPDEYVERRSSVGEVEALQPSLAEQFRTSLPILSVWVLSVVFSLFVYQTVLFSALFITALVTSIFMFMLPSMLYFRLGVKSDYESIPICGVIPNRLYMYVLQFLGILFIVGNFVGLSMKLYHNYHENHSAMYV